MSTLTITPIVRQLTVTPTVRTLTIQRNASTPTGPAGGDLSGAYPNPAIANDAVTYAKLQDVTGTDRLLGRSTAGAGDVEEIVCTAYARSVLDDADAATARTTLGVSAAGSLSTTDENSATVHFPVFVTGTGAQNAKVDSVTTPLQYTPSTGTLQSRNLRAHGSATSYVLLEGLLGAMSFVNGGNACTMYPFAFEASQAFSFSIDGAIVFFSSTGDDLSFTTSGSSLFKTGGGATEFVRVRHDVTNGLVESGKGKLRLKGASVVRIEGPSGGFDLPATAGSNGQVLTTDGSNASWQTPTTGVSEAFAIAMAVAL